ncbi:MAG: exodeoxyribonuclease III, partial [Thermomonas sp.]
MRILTFNANGLRSAASKGFFDWFAARDVDVLCVQETKAQEHQLSDAAFRPDGYQAWFKDASTKKGYSGVAIYSRRAPDEVRTALGWAPFDDEGRYIEARFGNLSVVSFYIPSGSSGELRQGFKEAVMAWLRPILDQWLASGREYVLCGDWNIVRAKNDIKN